MYVSIYVLRGLSVTSRPVSSDQHGTLTGYSYGCRCDPCRDAKSDYTRRWQEQKRASDRVPHGTCNGFDNYGCRCGPCSEAKRERTGSEESLSLHRKRQATYRAENREAYNQRQAAWRAENREAYNQSKADYRRRSRETPPPEFPHGEGGYVNYGCRCDVCVEATRAAARERRRAQQAATLGAPRWGYEWTGPELEIVATRDDLSVVEQATLLGRTARAVQKARDRVRHDPKWIQVAGISEQDD